MHQTARHFTGAGHLNRYKWYGIAALAVVLAIVITGRVRRRRAERAA